MVSEKTYFLSLSKKESVNGEVRIPTREIEIVVPKIAHTHVVFWVAFTVRGLFPSPRERLFFLSPFFRSSLFFLLPQKRAFLSLRERRHKNTTRITLYLSPSLEHRHTLKADINHAVSCIFHLSFSLVRFCFWSARTRAGFGFWSTAKMSLIAHFTCGLSRTRTDFMYLSSLFE